MKNVHFYERIAEMPNHKLFIFEPTNTNELLPDGFFMNDDEANGYIKYDRYMIPIYIVDCDRDKLKLSSAQDIIDYIDFMCNVRYVTTLGQNDACVLIGYNVLRNMYFSDIIPILYHEVAHILSPFYFDEAKADHFAVEHVGSEKFIEAFNHFEILRTEYKVGLASKLIHFDLSTSTVNTTIIELLRYIDDSLPKIRQEHAETYAINPSLPKMELYLNKNIIDIETLLDYNK